LPRRKRDNASTTSATLPNREANQLQAFERTVRKVQFYICKFPRRVALSFGTILIVIMSSLALCAKRPTGNAGPVRIRGGRTRNVPEEVGSVRVVAAQDVLECDQRVIGLRDSKLPAGRSSSS
jgi:hypothetical protein